MEKLPDFIQPDEPFSKGQISALERLLEFELPADYISFLQSYGGGLFPIDGMVVAVDWKRVDGKPVDEDDDDFEDLEALHPFFTLWDSDQIVEHLNSVEQVQGTVGPIVPPFFFPIGDDSGGAEYWLDLSPEQYGSVWLRYSNFDHAWGEGSNRYVGFVADSFSDFLFKRLQPLPEGW